MTEQEIEERILVCEIKERDYLEVGNTKTAERYSNEKYKWEKLLSRLDSKRDKQLADYRKGYNNLEQALNKINEYINNHIILIYTKNAPRELVGTKELLQIIDEALGDEK